MAASISAVIMDKKTSTGTHFFVQKLVERKSFSVKKLPVCQRFKGRALWYKFVPGSIFAQAL